MKKIKKIFGSNECESSKQNQSNIKQKCIKTDIIKRKLSNDEQKQEMEKVKCFHCVQNADLMEKYIILVKLLKIKIIKLEKNLFSKNTPDHHDMIQDFEDFNMDLDTASLQTLKNITQKHLSPFKILKFDPNIEADEISQSFDKTVLKVEKTGQVKSAKHLKNIISDFKTHINTNDHHYKTSKSIGKQKNKLSSSKKLSDQFGRQISFIKLMQKSQFSTNNSKKIIFCSNFVSSEYSSIKEIISDGKQRNLHLKQPKRNKNANQLETENQKKIKHFAQRIQFLTETIIDLKSFVMHVRHSIYQFTKMTDIKHLKNLQPSSYEMLRIIMGIFEFSEDQIQEMVGSKNKKGRQSKLHNFFFSNLAR